MRNEESRVIEIEIRRSGRGEFGAPTMSRANVPPRTAGQALASGVRRASARPAVFRRLTRHDRSDEPVLLGDEPTSRTAQLPDSPDLATRQRGRRSTDTYRIPWID
jgi:hypothetical protein